MHTGEQRSHGGPMRAFIGFVVRRRWWVLALVATLTGLAGAGIARMHVSNSLAGMLLGEHPEFDDYLETTKRFGSDPLLVFGIDEPDYLAPERQARLRRLVGALEDVEGVANVRSVLDAVRLTPGPLFPLPVRYVDEARAHPDRAPALQRRLAADPLLGGVLAGRDGASHAVLVFLDTDLTRTDETGRRTAMECGTCFDRFYDRDRVRVAGMAVVLQEVLVQTRYTLERTLPLAALILLAAVWLLFGRLWPAAIALVAGAVAVIWTLGVAAIVDPELNIMMAMIPVVILIVAFSDIVHLCSAYLLELEAGRPKREAILESCSDVGRACLFTSLTTLVGFVGLSFVPVPVFRTLGWTLGLGVALALALAVTLVPIVFTLMPAPRPLRGGVARHPQRWIDRGLAAARGLALRRPAWVIGAFALLAVGSAVGAARLEIETDFLKRLSEDNWVRVHAEWFGERFHGTNGVQLHIDAPTPAALEDPRWLARVAAYEDALRAQPGVRRVGSLVGVVSAIHCATPAGRDAPVGSLPHRPDQLRQAMRLLELGGADELRGLADRESGRLRMLVAMDDMGVRDTAAAADRFEALGPAHLGPRSAVHATSVATLLGGFLDIVLGAQQTGFAITVAAITLLMILGLRSVRVGLGSLLPNLLPLGAVAALLGLGWDRVDSDFFAVLLIALGIGVDDTIHFLARLRTESARGGGQKAAIERTYAFAGRGIVMTSVILSVAFLPFLLSDYFLLRMQGVLLPLSFGVALLADLLLIPAMAQVGWLRFQTTPAPRTAAPTAALDEPQPAWSAPVRVGLQP